MSKGSRIFNQRRRFLTTALSSAAYVSLLPFLSACSTLDEYLIEDQFDFDQEVVIIGGGIAGLYAAYELKRNKIPFKIFEASHRLGGKIQTIDNVEWGAFEFRKNDKILSGLVKELNIEKLDLDQKSWTLRRGAGSLVEELSEVVQGLIPEKQIRLQHRLISVRKIGQRYQLIFQTSQRERMYFARKVILALPQNVLLKLRNLDEVKEVQPLLAQISQAKNWANIRVKIPITAINSNYKNGSRVNSDLINATFYKMSAEQTAQLMVRQRLDLMYLTVRMTQDHPLRPVQHLEGFVQKLTNPDFRLDAENCKDWGLDGLDSRSTQEIDMQSIAFPTGRLRILTESFVAAAGLPQATAEKSSIESLLEMALQEVQFFKLDI